MIANKNTEEMVKLNWSVNIKYMYSIYKNANNGFCGTTKQKKNKKSETEVRQKEMQIISMYKRFACEMAC